MDHAHTAPQLRFASRPATPRPFLQKWKQRRSTNGKKGAFTLVEIMIVLAIIALLASIAIPNYLRARKRSQATRVIDSLRQIDSAMEQYALEKSKPAGVTLTFSDLKSYLKTGSTLYNSGMDLFGNNFGSFVTDSIPKVNASTYQTLSDVAPPEFWSPYL